jgi:hypothetical protein
MHSDTTYEVWPERYDRVLLSTESRAAVEYMAAQAFEAGDAEALKCRVFEVRHVNGWEPLPVQPLAAFVPPVMGPPPIDLAEAAMSGVEAMGEKTKFLLWEPGESPQVLAVMADRPPIPEETPPCDPPQAVAPVPIPKRRARKSK